MVSNWANAFDEFRQARAGIHAENLDLLGRFSGKLGYTRLGSVSNTDVYDFITKPVGLRQTLVARSGMFGHGPFIGNELWLAALTVAVSLLAAFIIFRAASADSLEKEADG